MKETEKENIGKLSTSEKKTNILSNVSKQKRHLQNEKTTAKRTKFMSYPPPESIVISRCSTQERQGLNPTQEPEGSCGSSRT